MRLEKNRKDFERKDFQLTEWSLSHFRDFRLIYMADLPWSQG